MSDFYSELKLHSEKTGRHAVYFLEPMLATAERKLAQIESRHRDYRIRQVAISSGDVAELNSAKKEVRLLNDTISLKCSEEHGLYH
jgi:hypothetical protein